MRHREIDEHIFVDDVLLERDDDETIAGEFLDDDVLHRHRIAGQRLFEHVARRTAAVAHLTNLTPRAQSNGDTTM